MLDCCHRAGNECNHTFNKKSIVIELVAEIKERTIQVRRNNKIILPDAIVAATALVQSGVLISRNSKDFSNIKHLKLIDPWNIKK